MGNTRAEAVLNERQLLILNTFSEHGALTVRTLVSLLPTGYTEHAVRSQVIRLMHRSYLETVAWETHDGRSWSVYRRTAKALPQRKKESIEAVRARHYGGPSK